MGESREVYIHSFSNGGMVFSSRAIDILQKSGVEIKSVVFDSAPSLEDSARVPALVFSESVPKEYQLAKTFVYYTTFFMLAMLRFVGDLLRINSHAKVQEYFGTRFVKNNLKHHPNVLFLSSSFRLWRFGARRSLPEISNSVQKQDKRTHLTTKKKKKKKKKTHLNTKKKKKKKKKK